MPGSFIVKAVFLKLLVRKYPIMIGKIRSSALDIWNDPLHRNSFFLMASTGVMSVVGFFFWFIAARLFSPESIGVAVTLISVSALLSYISTLGFPLSLIRYIPTSKKPSEIISNALMLTMGMSFLVSLSFVLISQYWFRSIFAIVSPTSHLIFFCIAVAFGTWQQVGNSIFIAFKKTQWIVLESLVYSLLKLSLIPFLTFFAGVGIYIGNYIGMLIAVSISLFIILRKLHIRYKSKINFKVAREMSKYTFATYIAGLISFFPAQILPSLITKFLGPSSTANFFLPLMMVNLLMIIPQANGQTLFASASAAPASFKSLTIASIKFQSMLVALGILSFFLLGGTILSLFGKSYQVEATMVLKILSLAVLPIMINTPLVIRLRVLKDLKSLNIITFLSSLSIVTFCVMGTKFGLIGVAYGYLIGQSLTTFLYLLHWKIHKLQKFKTT